MRISARRTRLLLRIRRMIFAQLKREHPGWPEATVNTTTTADMLEVMKLPNRKVRRIHTQITLPRKDDKPTEAPATPDFEVRELSASE